MVVYATDRSKAVVRLLFYMLWEVFIGTIMQTIMRTVVYFARAGFCPFSLPFGVRGWLRLVIVALPELFNYLFSYQHMIFN